jgi:proteic killer suppression protein
MKIAGGGTQDIFDGADTAEARRTLPRELHAKAARLMDRISAATQPADLRIPIGNRLEKLKGNRSGQYSVRINEQYRICFAWDGEATGVEITDYH